MDPMPESAIQRDMQMSQARHNLCGRLAIEGHDFDIVRLEGNHHYALGQQCRNRSTHRQVCRRQSLFRRYMPSIIGMISSLSGFYARKRKYNTEVKPGW